MVRSTKNNPWPTPGYQPDPAAEFDTTKLPKGGTGQSSPPDTAAKYSNIDPIEQRIVDLLNELLELDPDAANNLVNHAVFCNNRIADHPYIVVGDTPDGKTTVRLVGLLNGLLRGKRRLYYASGGEDDRVLKFFVDDYPLQKREDDKS